MPLHPPMLALSLCDCFRALREIRYLIIQNSFSAELNFLMRHDSLLSWQFLLEGDSELPISCRWKWVSILLIWTNEFHPLYCMAIHDWARTYKGYNRLMKLDIFIKNVRAFHWSLHENRGELYRQETLVLSTPTLFSRNEKL